VKFRWDPDLSVLWAGQRSYPATFRRGSARDHIPAGEPFLDQFPDYRMETRAACVMFENQWNLSTIWGDATYSSNRMTAEMRPFIEEPTHVEVGVLVPCAIEITIPAAEFDLPSGKVDLPERTTILWGEPLGYVSVEEYQRLADIVMMLPTDCELPDGEWDTAEGFCDLLITAGMAKTL
jgi:hypothetical protein